MSIAPSNLPQQIPLELLRTDGDTQPRAGLSQEVVEDYAEALRAGKRFPPVIAYHDKYHLWLADGFHREAAHRLAGLPSILAVVIEGDLDDAQLYSWSANQEHGLRRTNIDKERVVSLHLKHRKWGLWSDRRIAEHCGVSHTYVANLRDRLGQESRLRQAADGRIFDLGKPEAPPAPETPPTPEPDGAFEPGADIGFEDANGDPLPERCRPAFLLACAIGSTCREIDTLVRRVEEFAKQPGGRLLARWLESIRQQLRDARGNLWSNRATHLCPYCQGNDPACKACKGEGWVNAVTWQGAPGNSGRQLP